MSNHPVETVRTSNDKIKIVLAIGAVIAGVVGFYFLSGKPDVVRAATLLAGILVAIAVAWTSVFGRNFIGFAKESIREAKKVVWPTRKEAVQITAVVFGFVLIMAIFLWGIDKILEFVLYDLILGWK
ncbi:MAG TPA: preprotein translocase subunit SecE [Noviherbaspirillum sp.]|nr:preprotein translocase subunit SecE [Noviherbaspirillum sp.]